MLYGFLLTFVNGNATTLGVPSGVTSCGSACTELEKNEDTKSAEETTGIGTFIAVPENSDCPWWKITLPTSRPLSNKKVVPASSKAKQTRDRE